MHLTWHNVLLSAWAVATIHGRLRTELGDDADGREELDIRGGEQASNKNVGWEESRRKREQ